MSSSQIVLFLSFQLGICMQSLGEMQEGHFGLQADLLIRLYVGDKMPAMRFFNMTHYLQSGQRGTW